MNPQVPEAPVSIRPIGVVVSDFRDFTQRTDYEAESMIWVREDLADGLIGLEHFSHIYVLYYQTRRKEWQQFQGWASTDEQILTMPITAEPTCKGVYTTRAPARPSGIGFCVVELLRREGNRLYVRGLDAFDGTPVIDIKIYIPAYDSFPNAVSPRHWCIRQDISETSRVLHWDTMNVGLALGMRAGAAAMRLLNVGRGDASKAEVIGGHFFAQGVEGVTGCSPLRGNFSFTLNSGGTGAWALTLSANGETVHIALREATYAGADEVLTVPDDVLFTVCESVLMEARI